MINLSLINNLIKLAVKVWLESITDRIKIKTLNIVSNNKIKRNIKELYLEAKDLTYQNLYLNEIKIKIYNCTFRLNYNNHLIYSDNLIINCSLIIDNENLENIFFASKWDSFKIKIQEVFAESNHISNLVINDKFINLNYKKNNIDIVIPISIYLEGNLIYLENINVEERLHLPFDKNIKFKSCEIKNKQINLDFLSKVIFDS